MPKGSEKAQVQAGRGLRDRFSKSIPAFKHLLDTVQKAAVTRKWLKGLDGRQLHVRSKHSALNTLLQSAGALIVKKGTVIMAQRYRELGFNCGLVANVHDEVQIESDPSISNQVGTIAVESFAAAGLYFGLRIPISGEYKIGRTWADTH